MEPWRLAGEDPVAGRHYPRPEHTWQAINEFQATHDIPITADEEGNRLEPAALTHEPFVEFDDELILVDE